jgi:hypothetical protein
MRKLDTVVRGWRNSRCSHRNVRRRREGTSVAGTRFRTIFLSCIVLLLTPLLTSACGGSKGVPANVRKFGAVVNINSGAGALRVVGEICANIDCVKLLEAAFGSDKAKKGLPTGDGAVFTIIDKSKNSSMHWDLKKNVAAIEVEQRASDITPIVLKIINDDPLRIELWTSNSDEFTVNVTFK